MYYVGILKVQGVQNTSFIECSHGIAPVGEEVFAILGRDRVLYTVMSNEIGKEYAVRVLKKIAWNVKTVKIGRMFKGRLFRYTIPSSFAKALNIKKGNYVLALSTREDTLEIIPLSNILEKIGKFEEPII
jgi:hypothetical protein